MMLKFWNIKKCYPNWRKKGTSKNLWKSSVALVLTLMIYDLLICSNNEPSCDRKPVLNVFKSLDSFRMVCAEGWMSTSQTKTWADAVVIKGEIKPSH